MELNREQIIKALECCDADNPTCGDCPCYDNHDYCWNLNKHILSLINELTEERKGLENLIYEMSKIENRMSETIEELTEENERLKQERMNKIDIYKALDILDKFDFFQGQRAGRELWAEKPFETQEEDLKNFSKDVELLKDFVEDIAHKLKCAELQIEAKERICESYMLQYGTVADKEVWLKKERADTVREYREQLHRAFAHYDSKDKFNKGIFLEAADQIAEEMLEGV